MDFRLQRIADAIDDSLAQAGFALDRKTKQVKLHMTVTYEEFICLGFNFKKYR